jgi:predicted dehydrogenase
MPQWVFARKNKTADFTTYVNALLGYKDVNVLIEGGFNMAKQYPFTTGFRASNGEITLEYLNKNKKGLVMYTATQEIALDYKVYDPYQKELEYFLNCIQNGKEIEIGSGNAAANAVRIAQLIQESADKQEKVAVL